ncbi:MAG: HAMP domain-containing protein [Gemmatimonadetes bacterium]|nr:HAMP domain-containing protein [Gemmatimonadota bacterium]MDA1103311.1 HAMP domain-containing protein [Gemmatimonadota bacterium]
MDIRTKLVFALVSVALASMLTLGLIMYTQVEAELRVQTIEQLEGLAGFKAEAVEGIVAGWHDRVRLVASRTQLRMSISEYNRNGSAIARERIGRILGDAIDASPLFLQLWIHDPVGNVLARVGADMESAQADLDLLTHDPTRIETRYAGVIYHDNGPPTVSFSAVLALDGELLGYLHVVLSADEIARLSENYQGLGETGEAMVVTDDRAGAPRVLHPVRFPPEGGEDVDSGLLMARDGPAARALRGEETFAEGLFDYRGESVWATARLISETRWGVVVKVDAAEQNQPIVDFRNDMIRLAVTLSAFAILIGTFLGFRFAAPIHQLAAAANRIRSGDLSARSDIVREDEVGLLARTFDQMAGELEEQVTLLTEFRKFFDMSIDMLCIASTDGYFKRVNSSFVRELGWSVDELLKRPFVSLVHEDDRGATIAEIEKLASGVPTISFENRFLCMDGTYKQLLWNSYPDEETGHLYAIARVRPSGPSESF